jgi:hypothetical protein
MNLPVVVAFQGSNAFPDVSFKVFSAFVENTFGPAASLSTVLLLIHTILENPELITLHARQQCPKYQGEHCSSDSAWIKPLIRALHDRLGEKTNELFRRQEIGRQTINDEIFTILTPKLVALAQVLQFYPVDDNGQFLGKLKPVSQEIIQPIYIICPSTAECETMTCKPRSLLQTSKPRDVPKVTLIKDFIMHENALILSGKCPSCRTIYYADHERTPNLTEHNTWNRVYLNSAKYFKVGQSLWVDRLFSNAVLNSMYSFHASAAAYTEFWNNSFWKTQNVQCQKISQWQVWQAFVQESIRTIAGTLNFNLELRDGLAIDEVTKEAFKILGENGIIRAADKHSCSECTHQYKKKADILTADDPAALVGNDENRVVPPLVGEHAELARQDAARARANVNNQRLASANEDMDIDHAPVKIVILDGWVVGPVVCVSVIFTFNKH